ncbi:MAG: hypothetical protein OEM83_07230 [Gammaproteobacteria bacterium]|nr:hypothetical protein [Gammaproteobacteria bacterium]
MPIVIAAPTGPAIVAAMVVVFVAIFVLFVIAAVCAGCFSVVTVTMTDDALETQRHRIVRKFQHVPTLCEQLDLVCRRVGEFQLNGQYSPGKGGVDAPEQAGDRCYFLPLGWRRRVRPGNSNPADHSV